MNIQFAKSKAGHDKDQLYFILKEEEEFVYLVNGTTRPLDKPKKKRKKHVQVIHRIPAELCSILEAGITNESVKRSMKLYSAGFRQETSAQKSIELLHPLLRRRELWLTLEVALDPLREFRHFLGVVFRTR